MKTKWKDTPPLHKVITVFSVIVSLAVVTLAVLSQVNSNL